ncbi:MAG: GTP-binding protein [Chthoniobacterales bacterium]
MRPLMALASLFARENEEPRPLVRLAHASTAIRAEGLLHLLLPSTSKRAPGLACLTVEELEFAGEVVLESGSNVRDIELARAVVATLNPRAVLLDASSNYSAALLDPGKPAFDFGAALDAAEWRRLVEEQPDPVSYSYGMGAMAYRARKPFHPERLWRLLHEDLHNVFRAKGFVWLATRTDFVGGLNLAGSELQCAPAGQWWATRDADTREREMPARTRAQWHEPFGDRRQAIALMTMNVEPNVIRAQLDACLLTPDEMAAGPERWQHLPDPFPSWSTHGHHHDCGHDHDECDHEHGPEPHDCCHH